MSPLAVAQRVPPAAAVMVDDDDLALAAAVFEAAAGAFRAVEPPHRRQPLQQHGAAHARPSAVQSLHPAHSWLHAPLGIGRAGGTASVVPLSVLPRRLTPRQPRSRRGARACAARERAARRTLAARPAQAVALFAFPSIRAFFTRGIVTLQGRDALLRPGERSV